MKTPQKPIFLGYCNYLSNSWNIVPCEMHLVKNEDKTWKIYDDSGFENNICSTKREAMKFAIKRMRISQKNPFPMPKGLQKS